MAKFTGRLNIIGAGQLGKTMGRLFSTQAGLQVGDVLNRSMVSAQQAVEFMGSGLAIAAYSELKLADYYLLACPDKEIENCCQQLAASDVLQADSIVFHCSGALSSRVLSSAAEQGAQVASVHPVRSFANPTQSVEQFAGTYCGMEGDAAALKKLEALFIQLGAIPFRIDPTQKALYHAASVMACNYLVTLQEVSLQAFEQAGVERKLAMNILQPLVEGTVANIFRSGTVASLTGPVVRGEHEVVAAQLNALENWRPELAALYKLLGEQTVALADEQHRSTESPPDLAAITKLFSSSSADNPF